MEEVEQNNINRKLEIIQAQVLGSIEILQFPHCCKAHTKEQENRAKNGSNKKKHDCSDLLCCASKWVINFPEITVHTFYRLSG